MSVPAISVMANHRHQALLLREGGWGATPPRDLEACGTPAGTAIHAGGDFFGLAQASAMGALASCSEFHLGEVRLSGIDQVGTVRLAIVAVPAPGSSR